VANTTKKANTTDFIDPKPFPNPTPVPLAKANKGDTPEKKAPEAAPEAAVQVKANVTTNVTAKANTTTSANVTQAAVKKWIDDKNSEKNHLRWKKSILIIFKNQ